MSQMFPLLAIHASEIHELHRGLDAKEALPSALHMVSYKLISWLLNEYLYDPLVLRASE